ncbi:MAG: hypothetical protein ACE3L7_18950 [Candidatus Pristimantibacillus sp.]
MSKKLVWGSIVMMLVLVLVTACGGKEKKVVDVGTTDKGTYTNEYFGVSLQFPQEWVVQDQAAMEELNKAGIEAIAGDDAKKEKALDLSQLKTVNLLMTSKLPMDGASLSPSIISNAEKLSMLQGIKTGKDYLTSAQKIMVDANLPYEFKEITSVKVGGKDFDVLEATVSNGELVITQHYYSAIMEGYSFNLITTSYDDESKAEIDKIIGSVTFK